MRNHWISDRVCVPLRVWTVRNTVRPTVPWYMFSVRAENDQHGVYILFICFCTSPLRNALGAKNFPRIHFLKRVTAVCSVMENGITASGCTPGSSSDATTLFDPQNAQDTVMDFFSMTSFAPQLEHWNTRASVHLLCWPRTSFVICRRWTRSVSLNSVVVPQCLHLRPPVSMSNAMPAPQEVHLVSRVWAETSAWVSSVSVELSVWFMVIL